VSYSSFSVPPEHKSSVSLTYSGIYAAGYAERRAERIKANYGIDVPKTAADS
jgi:hypothetical protein